MRRGMVGIIIVGLYIVIMSMMRPRG
jgi:hypothetical protein